MRELPTSEVAKIIGVSPDVLRKRKTRGFLKLAPQGVSGQGRGVECRWSQKAIDEARAWAAQPRKGRRIRTRGQQGPSRARLAFSRWRVYLSSAMPNKRFQLTQEDGGSSPAPAGRT